MNYIVLIASNSSEAITQLEHLLSSVDDGFSVSYANTPNSLFTYLEQVIPDVVFFDATFSANSSAEIIAAVKGNPLAEDVPIIAFAQANTNSSIKLLFQAGIDDFITIPVSVNELLQRIELNFQKGRLMQKLRKQSHQFKEISLAASSAGTSVLIIDSTGEITWVNDGFERLYECNLATFSSIFGTNLFDESLPENTVRAMKTCRIDGEYIVYDSLWTTPSGKVKYIQTSLTPVFDSNKQISKIVAIESDITGIKEAERELSDKHDHLLSIMEHLEQANTMLDEQRTEIEKQKSSIEEEQAKSEELLRNILPWEVARQLRKKGTAPPKKFKEVSVMFADFVGFSKVSVSFDTIEDFIKELSFYFENFEEITSARFIEKIKTIGDCYMCVGGIPRQNHSHAFDTVLAALEIQRFVEEIAQKNAIKKKPVWRLRIGIHTGSVVAGVIGKKKFAYDVWGDTVNVASRMESSGEAGKVNVSETTYQYIKDFFLCTYRGKVPAKNIGDINMYFVERILPDYAEDAEGFVPNAAFRKILASY
ncbi:MAG: response regulator [Bacteroidales bacterium]|nr:response regulator [Bacteroidales bacterium]MBN2750162.1 response regulator [Bacteroidales bacterium]